METLGKELSEEDPPWLPTELHGESQEIQMKRASWKVVLAAAIVAPLAVLAQQPTDPPGTFSILGYDSESGEVGAAVQSRVFSVGNGVLWAEAGVGAELSKSTRFRTHGVCTTSPATRRTATRT